MDFKDLLRKNMFKTCGFLQYSSNSSKQAVHLCQTATDHDQLDQKFCLVWISLETRTYDPIMGDSLREYMNRTTNVHETFYTSPSTPNPSIETTFRGSKVACLLKNYTVLARNQPTEQVSLLGGYCLLSSVTFLLFCQIQTYE